MKLAQLVELKYLKSRLVMEGLPVKCNVKLQHYVAETRLFFDAGIIEPQYLSHGS